jgi:hypothetical protein
MTSPLAMVVGASWVTGEFTGRNVAAMTTGAWWEGK